MLTVISRCSAEHLIHYLRMSLQILRMQYNSSDGSSSVDQRSTRPKSCEAQYAYHTSRASISDIKFIVSCRLTSITKNTGHGSIDNIGRSRPSSNCLHCPHPSWFHQPSEMEYVSKG